MTETPFVPVARVIKAHGTRGEVSVSYVVDTPSELPESLEVWVVPPPSGERSGVIESVRPGPKGPLVKISGFDDRTAAEALRGRMLVARPADLPAHIAEPPFDPVGMAVHDESRGFLGTVTEVIETGANDVWIVEDGPFGQVLIPVIDDVVISLDEDSRAVSVRLLEGLLEEGTE